jgi:hypothetical protein
MTGLFWQTYFGVSLFQGGCPGILSSRCSKNSGQAFVIPDRGSLSIPGLVKKQIITYFPDHEKIFKKPADTRAGVTFSR